MSSPILPVSIASSIAAQNRRGCPYGHPRTKSAEALLEVALDLPAQVPVGDLATAIPALLALREGQLDLGPRPLEVDPGRNQGQPALGGLANKALDLPAMKEELARPIGIVVLIRRRQVWRDVGPAQPNLTA